MFYSSSARPPARKRHRPRVRRATIRSAVRSRGRALRMLSAGSPAVRIILGAVLLLGLWLAANWVVQVVRKPTELFFPLSGTLSKTPRVTWRHYGPAFRAHATAVITPEFLAALAQVEGAGNPVARTYWRWQLTSQPFELYRPASSAVGMYQITDGTFREAKRYCIHDHAVIQDGAWHNPRSCWFNGLYTRVLPSHAIELTASLLDNRVTSILQRKRITTATLQQKQKLAAIIHLCGAGAGEAYAKRGFRLTPNQRCGDHDVRGYLARIDAFKRVFARLATAG